MTALDYKLGDRVRDTVTGLPATVIGYYSLGAGGPYPWKIRFDDGSEVGANGTALEPLRESRQTDG